MSRQQFIALLVIALALVVALLMLAPGEMDGEPVNGGLFLEEIESGINEVDGVVITGSGDQGQVHLDRGDQAWTIQELHDYPADWQRLRTLLAGLAEARIVELKTTRPEYYSRLGVSDLDSEGATGSLLELKTGEDSLDIIIGNQSSTRQGQFVRLSGNVQSLLIDQELDFSPDPVSWADSELLDIGSALVAEMQIRHADGDQVVIRKVSADETDFNLQGLPENRKTKSSWTVNSLANNFSLLSMDDVLPDAGLQLEASVSISVITFSGLRLETEAFDINERGWIRVRASAPDAEPVVQEQAENINHRLGGWVYRIPETKFEAMTKRMDQMLESEVQSQNQDEN